MSLPGETQMPEAPKNIEPEIPESITLGGRIGLSLLLFFALTIMTIELGKFVALFLW